MLMHQSPKTNVTMMYQKHTIIKKLGKNLKLFVMLHNIRILPAHGRWPFKINMHIKCHMWHVYNIHVNTIPSVALCLPIVALIYNF